VRWSSPAGRGRAATALASYCVRRSRGFPFLKYCRPGRLKEGRLDDRYIGNLTGKWTVRIECHPSDPIELTIEMPLHRAIEHRWDTIAFSGFSRADLSWSQKKPGQLYLLFPSRKKTIAAVDHICSS
jgi:hypothetical protein